MIWAWYYALQIITLFGLINISTVWEIHNSRLGQRRKKNQRDFLQLTKITKEKANYRSSKIWYQGIQVFKALTSAVFLLHLQTKEALVKFRTFYHFNFVLVYLKGNSYRKNWK